MDKPERFTNGLLPITNKLERFTNGSLPAKRRPPVQYSDILYDDILDKVSKGGMLAEICREEGKPDRTSFYSWIHRTKENEERFACARNHGFDIIAENALQIARGNVPFSTGDIDRDKLIIETELKLLAKWSPRYSDKPAQNNVQINLGNQSATSNELIAIDSLISEFAAPASSLAAPAGPLIIDNEDDHSDIC